MNYPWPLYIGLWLVVEVTDAFPKEGLTGVLGDSVCDFAVYLCTLHYKSVDLKKKDNYQPWSDNEWLVEKILVLLDKDITMQ